MDIIKDPSLVLYLPLYLLDGKTFQSKDMRGHLCTATGAVWRPNGRYFDGTNDKMVVPEHSSLDLATEVTMEAWFKIEADPGAVENWLLMIKGTTYANENYALSINLSTTPGNDRFYIGTTNGAANILVPDWVARRWYHAAGTVDSAGGVVGYLDGVNVGTASGKTITANNNDLTIGYVDDAAGWGGTYWANFTVGELRVYNRALTPLEIQRNYLATKWRYK